MDEKLLRKLSRQIRLLNYFFAFFSIIIIVGFVVIGLLLWQIITFAQNVNQKVDSTTKNLNVKKQACNDGRLAKFLKNNSDFCKKEK